MADNDLRSHSLQTRAVHAGDPEERIGGALVMPIFQSAVFEHWGAEAGYHDVLYPRLNNLPNQRAIGAKLASLEGAEAGLVTSSGAAAISTTLFSVLGRGGHALFQNQLYGGTHMLVTEHFDRFGMTYTFIDPGQPDGWAAAIRPETRVIYTESITNPTMQVIDHERVVAFAREHGLVAMIDNTFASPVNFRPIELGYDLAVHSATKYLNGHSDLAAGAVVGDAARIESVLHLLNELGGTLDPLACFLLNRGVKTLTLRVREQNRIAGELARFLDGRDEVVHVNYPGLETHPQHALARKLFDGFGGMLSFELAGGAPAAQRLFERVTIPTIGPSLGGVETLLTRPAATSHRGLDRDERLRLGIADGLIRVSTGIESAEDLIRDFEQALDTIG